eukprot:TRINITY_DN25403_c0_g1_i3.p1 TRINITY_DN25403_c0_g1~~TRINITY_DN25403_c0_g1_i3.p1  ORF type:complete len:208 (-),score=12.81 TRINITY_DN25403_c0_g1_i3:399-1022(-)
MAKKYVIIEAPVFVQPMSWTPAAWGAVPKCTCWSTTDLTASIASLRLVVQQLSTLLIAVQGSVTNLQANGAPKKSSHVVAEGKCGKTTNDSLTETDNVFSRDGACGGSVTRESVTRFSGIRRGPSMLVFFTSMILLILFFLIYLLVNKPAAAHKRTRCACRASKLPRRRSLAQKPWCLSDRPFRPGIPYIWSSVCGRKCSSSTTVAT